MPSETGEKRPVRAQTVMGSHPPPKSTSNEPLPCPRCDSTNTKFCYYNNYNLSQPRHFCKSCRRYWTQGGALRNVPVGGGSRKSSSKRSRASNNMSSSNSTTTTNSSSSTASNSTSLSSLTHEHESKPALPPGHGINPQSVLPVLKPDKSDDSNLKENQPMSENGSFISLLNTHQQGGGFVGLQNGYGAAYGYGFCEMGLGLGGGGRGIWPYTTSTEFLGGCGDPLDVGASGCNTWQLGDVEGVGNGGSMVDSEGFAWPGFVIPTPAKGLMK